MLRPLPGKMTDNGEHDLSLHPARGRRKSKEGPKVSKTKEAKKSPLEGEGRSETRRGRGGEGVHKTRNPQVVGCGLLSQSISFANSDLRIYKKSSANSDFLLEKYFHDPG